MNFLQISYKLEYIFIKVHLKNHLKKKKQGRQRRFRCLLLYAGDKGGDPKIWYGEKSDTETRRWSRIGHWKEGIYSQTKDGGLVEKKVFIAKLEMGGDWKEGS